MEIRNSKSFSGYFCLSTLTFINKVLHKFLTLCSFRPSRVAGFLPCVAVFTKTKFHSNPFALTQRFANNYNNLYLNFWQTIFFYNILPPRGEAQRHMRVGSPARMTIASRNSCT
ncbi:unnamed protein product [Ixodes persulcatus]